MDADGYGLDPTRLIACELLVVKQHQEGKEKWRRQEERRHGESQGGRKEMKNGDIEEVFEEGKGHGNNMGQEGRKGRSGKCVLYGWKDRMVEGL